MEKRVPSIHAVEKDLALHMEAVVALQMLYMPPVESESEPELPNQQEGYTLPIAEI